MTDILSFEIPEAHYAAIGKVAAMWARFEMLIDGAIGRVSCVHEETAACVTAQIAGHGRKLNALLALMKKGSASKSIIQEMNNITSKAHRLAEKRNRLIHDPWVVLIPESTNEPQIHRFEVTARDELKFHFPRVSTSDLINTSTEITGLTNQFLCALERFEHERLK